MVQKFYVCPICGNIIAYAKCSGVDVICCRRILANLIIKNDFRYWYCGDLCAWAKNTD